MAAGLFEGEGAGFAAAVAIGFPTGFGRVQFGFDAGDGGVKGLLAELTFPDGDDRLGEGVEPLGAELVTGNVAGNLLLPEVGVAL